MSGANKPAPKKKTVNYPITNVDKKYIEDIRAKLGITDSLNSDVRTYNLIAYHDKNAGEVKLISDEYFEIQLDVLPIPYIGKFFKGIVSIDEYARFYNVWEDSIHIQEEKRGIYFYKIRSDGSYQLLKYYGDRRRRKHREGRLYHGPDIVSILHSKFNGDRLNHIKTFAFGFPYFGNVDDHGDSISLDPNKFYVIEKKGAIPIIDDKNIPIKNLYAKFDESGAFVKGGGLIKKGFDTHVIIKEIID